MFLIYTTQEQTLTVTERFSRSCQSSYYKKRPYWITGLLPERYNDSLLCLRYPGLNIFQWSVISYKKFYPLLIQ